MSTVPEPDEALDDFPGYLLDPAPRRDETPVSIVIMEPRLVLRHGERLPRHADTGERCDVPRWSLPDLPPGSWRLA